MVMVMVMVMIIALWIFGVTLKRNDQKSKTEANTQSVCDGNDALLNLKP